MQRTIHIALPLLLAMAAGHALAQGEPSLRIGVFDPEAVWKSTEVGKKYNQDQNDARDRLQGEIDKKQAEIDALKDKLRQQQQSLSEDKAAQMQKDIQNKRVELNRMNEDATNDMKQQLNEVQGRFQQMLSETLDAFGKEKHFSLILNKAVVDFNAAQIDITQDLISKFNEVNKATSAPVTKSPSSKPPASKTPEKKAPDKTTKEPPKDTPHN